MSRLVLGISLHNKEGMSVTHEAFERIGRDHGYYTGLSRKAGFKIHTNVLNYKRRLKRLNESGELEQRERGNDFWSYSPVPRAVAEFVLEVTFRSSNQEETIKTAFENVKEVTGNRNRYSQEMGVSFTAAKNHFNNPDLTYKQQKRK